MLEAQTLLTAFAPERRPAFVRQRVVRALKAEIASVRSTEVSLVDLGPLVALADPFGAQPEPEEPHQLHLVAADEIVDEVTARAELVRYVRTVLAGMPSETAAIVALRFGLDDDDQLDPTDIADLLDRPPEAVVSHLEAAEKLFRHLSSEGRHRRLNTISETEFRSLCRLGDLAWYDLRHLNFNNRHLGGVDLSNAVLSGMNLWGVTLAESTLDGANLWGAQLEGADLTNASLHLANLERAGLSEADLSGAVLSSANLWGADLRGATLERAVLTESDLRGALLTGADLTRADLTGADLRGADLRNTRLIGAELVKANLQGAELAGADVRWADLRRSDLCSVNLVAANTAGASMQGAARSSKRVPRVAPGPPRPRRLRPISQAG